MQAAASNQQPEASSQLFAFALLSMTGDGCELSSAKFQQTAASSQQPEASSQQLAARSLLCFAWDVKNGIGDEPSSANNASEYACQIYARLGDIGEVDV